MGLSPAPGAAPRVCVAGCGHWGKNLIRNFEAIGALHGVYDVDKARAKSLAASLPGASCYDSYADALADPAISAVIIATPAEQHAIMALQAIEAGKDVFVEKPLALTAADGQRMVDSARSHRRLLMVGHLLLYHPAVRALRLMAESGELGRVEYIYSNRLSMGKIRQEENALWSFAPHDISVILMLMGGAMPLQASATGGAYLQPNIADVTLSTLLFDRGARAHIFVSWLHPYKEQRLVVIGSKKMLVFEDSRPTDKLLLYDKEVAWKDGAFQASSTKGVPVPFENVEPLRAECAHFLECVALRREPATPGEDGVRVLEVLEACQRSLQMNGEPVQVTASSGRILSL
jgi:UDP-2-acetamido-3-amino-2,3-dideoxy-glucuronate N-acetyltransferase